MTALEDEAKTMLWMEEVLGRPAESSSLITELEDGVVLCDIASKVLDKEMRGVNRGPRIPPFKRRENIKLFLVTAKEAGLRAHELFETIDLEGSRDAVSDQLSTNVEAISRCLARFSQLGHGPRLILDSPSAGVHKIQGFEEADHSEVRQVSEAIPSNARGARGTRARGSFVRMTKDEALKDEATPPKKKDPPVPTKIHDDPTVVSGPLMKPEDLKPPPVAFCKERCVLWWPKQREGDERFNEIVDGLPDEDFKNEIKAMCIPGTKLKIEYKPKSGCVVSSEDADGNCCEMELDWSLD